MNFPALLPFRRLAGIIAIAAVFVVQDLSPAAAQDNTLENYRSRIETLEQGIKDVRGTLERDLYAIRQAIEANKGLSGDDLVALRNQIDKLVMNCLRSIIVLSGHFRQSATMNSACCVWKKGLKA